MGRGDAGDVVEDGKMSNIVEPLHPQCVCGRRLLEPVLGGQVVMTNRCFCGKWWSWEFVTRDGLTVYGARECQQPDAPLFAEVSHAGR